MKINVGGSDRFIRFLVGILLAFIGFLAPLNTAWQVVVLIVAAILLLTAAIRFCPINAALGVDTSEHEEKK